MKSIVKFVLPAIVSTCVGCFGLAAQTTDRLPGLADWFLSTGDWQTGPQLYVREFGTGSDTVIMLHGGWGAEHSGLLTAVSSLGEEFHFVFYDQRGSLRSPFPDSLITFDQHVEDVERLRKELRLNKVTLAGHSMGAVLASAYASKYPHRIRQLILMAPAPLKQPFPEEDKALQHEEYLELQKFLNRPQVAQELEKHNLNRTATSLSSLEETAKFRIELAKRMLCDVSKWTQMTGGRALFKFRVFDLTAQTYPSGGWNCFQEFAKQQYPVSIIIGDHDWLDFGAGINRKWAAEVPRAQFSLIANAGHDLWIDQPQLFADELKRQLKSGF